MPKADAATWLEREGERNDEAGDSVEHDPRFLARVERARRSLKAGRGVRLEDVE